MSIKDEGYNQLQFESGYRKLSSDEVNTMTNIERERSKTSPDIIYDVKSTDTDRDYHLAYVTCDNIQDIHTLFEEQKGYGLKIEPIKILHISADKAEEIRELKADKINAERRLNEINSNLRGYGVKL